MRPYRIRYVPFKQRLYVPTMADNAVIEINPTDNSVTNVFTGFDIPWDIVTTAPDAWDSATEYAIDDKVEFEGIVYTALTISTNSQPDENPTDWSAGGAPSVYAVQLGRLGLRLVV